LLEFLHFAETPQHFEALALVCSYAALYYCIFISSRAATIWIVGPDGIRRGIVNPASCPAQTILLVRSYAASRARMASGGRLPTRPN
jgi:hypothetical protein